MKTCVVIPTCNRTQLLRDCIKSVDENTGGQDLVIVVVDSSKPIIPVTSSRFETCTLPVDDSIGFSHAVNVGAEAGFSRYSADFIVWLNDDCVVYKDWFTPMYSLMEGSARNKLKVGIGVFFFSDNRWPGQPPHVFFYKNQAYPCFGCLPRNVWAELQGFDERYFSYGAETDIAFRCIQKGYLVEAVKGACIHHLYVKDEFRVAHMKSMGTSYEDLRVSMYGEDSPDDLHWMDEKGNCETHRQYGESR